MPGLHTTLLTSTAKHQQLSLFAIRHHSQRRLVAVSKGRFHDTLKQHRHGHYEQYC